MARTLWRERWVFPHRKIGPLPRSVKSKHIQIGEDRDRHRMLTCSTEV
jgi:hypothetical protein